MTIRQERMIVLINAANEYRSALNLLCECVQRNTQLTFNGAVSYEDAFAEVAALVNHPNLVPNKKDADYVINTEHYHYTRNQASNKRRAEKAAERRAETATKTYNKYNLYDPISLLPLSATARPIGMNDKGHLPQFRQPSERQRFFTIDEVPEEEANAALARAQAADRRSRERQEEDDRTDDDIRFEIPAEPHQPPQKALFLTPEQLAHFEKLEAITNPDLRELEKEKYAEELRKAKAAIQPDNLSEEVDTSPGEALRK